VHYDLVLGQQHVKDYRLPIEDQLLATTIDVYGIPIPQPRMELIILALRAVLKYHLRDALKDMLGVRSPGIPGAIRTEAQWLLGHTTLEEVRRTLDELRPSMPAELVLEIIALLTSARVRGLRLLVVRELVRKALRPMLRLPRWRATGRYLAALGRKRAHAAGVGTKRRMTLRTRGTTIAFVGSDGAGKSTVVAAVNGWLGWRLDVASLYMGIPEPNVLRRILKATSKLARSANRRVESNASSQGLATRALRDIGQVSLGLRRVGEARSRVRNYRLASRRVAEGAIVLFDRYPLPSVPVFGRAMDGARLDQEIAQPRAPGVARLVAQERGLYARIAPPDHILALNVSAAESLRRKPDHDPDGVAAKTAAIRTSVTDSAHLVVIDADQDIDGVLAEVKATIWEWL
jgi:thymidylate kinase